MLDDRRLRRSDLPAQRRHRGRTRRFLGLGRRLRGRCPGRFDKVIVSGDACPQEMALRLKYAEWVDSRVAFLRRARHKPALSNCRHRCNERRRMPQRRTHLHGDACPACHRLAKRTGPVLSVLGEQPAGAVRQQAHLTTRAPVSPVADERLWGSRQHRRPRARRACAASSWTTDDRSWRSRPDATDLFFIGGGQDREQELVAPTSRQGPRARRRSRPGRVSRRLRRLSVSAASTATGRGRSCPGSVFCRYHTVAGERRMIGDVLLDCVVGGRHDARRLREPRRPHPLDDGAEPLGRVVAASATTA